MALRSISRPRVFTYSVQCPFFTLSRSIAASVDRMWCNKTQKVEKVKQTAEIKEPPTWVPDPETGYYKPYDPSPQTDPADLRQKLLNNNIPKP